MLSPNSGFMSCCLSSGYLIEVRCVMMTGSRHLPLSVKHVISILPEAVEVLLTLPVSDSLRSVEVYHFLKGDSAMTMSLSRCMTEFAVLLYFTAVLSCSGGDPFELVSCSPSVGPLRCIQFQYICSFRPAQRPTHALFMLSNNGTVFMLQTNHHWAAAVCLLHYDITPVKGTICKVLQGHSRVIKTS